MTVFSNLDSCFPLELDVNSFTISWSANFPLELDVNSFTISWSANFPFELVVNSFKISWSVVEGNINDKKQAI